MRVSPFLVLSVSLLAATSSSGAEQSSLSDNQISEMLVGSWIMSPDDPNYEGIPFEDVFYDDGTYVLYLFSGLDCRQTIGRVEHKWKVEDGILIWGPSQDELYHDEILSIDDSKLRGRSIDYDVVFERIKSPLCPDAPFRPDPPAPHDTDIKAGEARSVNE